jgi:hypothetical protein
VHFLFVLALGRAALCSAIAFRPGTGSATDKLFATHGRDNADPCRGLDDEPGNQRHNGRNPIEKMSHYRRIFYPLFNQRFWYARHDQAPQ